MATHHFLSDLRTWIAEGLPNPEIAEALNAAGYRTPGKGVTWTWGTVRRFRQLNADIVEVLEADTPMPEYPRPKSLTEAEILCGSPFYDTDSWGNLAIPIPNIRRTK